MRMTSGLPPVVAATLVCVIACSDRAYDPSLVTHRDSAGVEIVETLRPLWGDVPAWTVDPEPLVDLTLGGPGKKHLFHHVRAMVRLSDGTIAVADGGSDEIRLYSETGEFESSAGGRGDGPGEFDMIVGLARGRGDTLIALDHSDRVALYTADLTFVRYSLLPPFSLAVHTLVDGTLIVETEMMSLEILEAGGLVRVPTVLWRFDPDDDGADSIGATAGEEQHVVLSGPGQGQTGTLFGRRSHIATRGDRIYQGHAVSLEVEELTAAGKLVRILRVPGYPLALRAEAIRAERRAMLGDDPPEWFRQVIEEVPAPSVRPSRLRRPAAGSLRCDLASSLSWPERAGRARDVAGPGKTRDVAGGRRVSRGLPGHGDRHGHRAGCVEGRMGCGAPPGAAAESAMTAANCRPPGSIHCGAGLAAAERIRSSTSARIARPLSRA